MNMLLIIQDVENAEALPEEEVLDAEVKARVPMEYRNQIEAIATLRHLKVSDILREAIREKIEKAKEVEVTA